MQREFMLHRVEATKVLPVGSLHPAIRKASNRTASETDQADLIPDGEREFTLSSNCKHFAGNDVPK